MATLYIASTETFVGKSAMCAVMLEYFRSKGCTIGYMKPVSVSVTQTENGAVDLDAKLMHDMFDLQEPLEQLAPVLATTGLIERVLNGESTNYAQHIKQTYEAIAHNKDIVILEGANTWAEGALLNLNADQVSDLLDAPVLLINRFRSIVGIDIILAVQRYLGKRLIGVVLNQVFPSHIERVEKVVAPFLEKQGIPVLGIIPHNKQIDSPSVQDVIEHINARVISDGDRDRLVEKISVGAMSADAALSFFRRNPNKVVITGGDRSDIQLAALQTSTACIILTGNMYPAATVLNRAAEHKVPLLLTSEDTLTTVQQLEALVGHLRFGSARSNNFVQLAIQNLDWPRLEQILGIANH